eukprot:TRINITY_DN76604_c0_g1_i1.p2 TRINITY_DN76604_c0_g1~~TRINITY_DN76604_c0_g1_i1.p2  ORF type:complete len:130 (-),score=23.10 TRINITY_DN76604_c0_g1_i1:30-419(-)
MPRLATDTLAQQSAAPTTPVSSVRLVGPQHHAPMKAACAKLHEDELDDDIQAWLAAGRNGPQLKPYVFHCTLVERDSCDWSDLKESEEDECSNSCGEDDFYASGFERHLGLSGFVYQPVFYFYLQSSAV